MPGIFIPDGGQLRIPGGSLTILLGDDGDVEIPPVQVELALDMWPLWLDVAIDHAGAALAARIELVAAVSASGHVEVEGQLQAELLARECKAAMVAIAASAFALDNFHSVTQPFVPGGEELRARFKAKRTARHRRISESIRRTFKVPNKGAKRLHELVEQIFGFRDWAVHPPAEFRTAVKHDYLDVGVEWRFVAFRASNAVSATKVAASLIDQSVNAPRKGNDPLAAWCEGQRERSKRRWERVELELVADAEPA